MRGNIRDGRSFSFEGPDIKKKVFNKNNLKRESITLVVVGDKNNDEAKKLYDDCLKFAPSRKNVRFLDFSKDKEELKKRGYPNSGKALIFTCVGSACLPPFDDWKKAGKAIIEFFEKLK